MQEMGAPTEGGQKSEVWDWGVKLECRVGGCRDLEAD